MPDFPEFEALLIDMDGVVIDSEPIHDAAQRIVFREFNLDVPESTFPSFRGMREKEVYEQIVRDYAGGNGDVDGMVAAKERTYRTLLKDLKMIPGASNFLANAGQLYRLALTTSSASIDQQIAFERFDLAAYFEVIVTAEDIDHPKPHPQPYLVTAAKLGLAPSVCLVIEDSVNGVRSAVRAGCTVAGMTTSFDSDALARAGAHFTVESYDELAECLGVRMIAPE
jgi:beta-phosphoglucomutase